MSSSEAGFTAAWTSVAEVDGWMSEAQGRVLFDAAAGCPSGGRIVEIGSFQGRSTIVLALAAPSDVEIVAIDPHAGNDRGPQEIEGFEAKAGDDHECFEANLVRAGVRHRVIHVREFSERSHGFVTGPIDLLYVDGAHRYRPARADIADWGAQVGDGGTLLIHDSFSSIGVTLAIVRELLWHPRFRYSGRSRSLAIYRADASGNRFANVVRQLAQLPWFAKNIVLKAMLTVGLGALLRRFGRPVPDWPY